ncbi:MinD/ParA family ATP-binding protein [Micromonospora eburnea]|uniref:MinD-like ATPase involved in chromosome partitioning or flagellar assembly n=1 Tax=Micromonospora eburnea TaxID=227316 RepID=A0A1C6TQQ0_9ACTN|nr:chromosome partitioning protein [Micromonospora eburnea]SCL43951.1 MinD-like ATPase involved in chromosome partitioning or flagellar assembly [Micromonospora eburnea]
MVHENADRAHVPGQPHVPERDIEPLWPPDPTDPDAAAPPWAAPQPAAPAWPTPPASAAWPPAPPQPVEPADGPPPDRIPSNTGNGTAVARTVQPSVDLDLPFTLDHPPAAPDGRAAGSSRAAVPATPDGPATEAAVPLAAAEAVIPPAADGTATTPPTAGEAGAGLPPTAEATTVVPPTSDATTVVPPTADATTVVVPPTADEAAGGSGRGGDATATAGSRNESPWAQPPQRLSNSANGPSGGTPTSPPAEATTAPVTPPATQAPPPGPVMPPAADMTAPDPVMPPAAEAPPPGPDGRPAATAAGDGGSPPRLGPFPPAPGVPMQPPYGDGTAYPPGPVGYGHPTTSAYPPPPQAGGSAPPPDRYPTAWPQQGFAVPQQPGPPAAQQPVPAAAYPAPAWTPESGATPTAEDFARRRQARPADPVATMGVRAVVNRMGLVRLPPGRHEQEVRRDIEMVRRNFGGLRQVTVVNPKGGAGKTVAILLLAMTFGQKRGGYVLAWDNNETQGTLGMRAQQDFHSRTVRDMLRDLGQFQGPHGRVGDLSQYVRSQGEGMFDVLASDESATGGEMLTAAAFAEIREVVSRFYKLIFVDTGNNVRAQNWQAAMDATDQLVVTMSARNDSAETAARMLDHLEQSGRQRLVRQAVTVVSMPPSRKEIDLPAIQQHFAARTRAVLLAPYERLIDTGEPIRYGQLSSATRDAWLKIAAAVAEGL